MNSELIIVLCCIASSTDVSHCGNKLWDIVRHRARKQPIAQW